MTNWIASQTRTRRFLERFAAVQARSAVVTALILTSGQAAGQGVPLPMAGILDLNAAPAISFSVSGNGSINVSSDGSISFSGNGSFNVGADGSISLSGGALAPTSPVSGGGSVSLAGGSIGLSGGAPISLASSGSVSLASGSINLSGGAPISLASGGSVSLASGSLSIASSPVTVVGGGTVNLSAGVLTVQNPVAIWNDARITIDASRFYSSGGVAVGNNVADLPAQALYGILVSNGGNVSLYRAGSGAIEPSRFVDSVQQASFSSGTAMSAIGTVPNGAHSRPLQYLAATGAKVAWVAGDLGRDDHDSRDGHLALGEVGLGYNFGPGQLNVSLGRTRTGQNTPYGGATGTRGNYLLTEGLIPLSPTNAGSRLWLTLSGYGHWGDADIRRGYLNLGAQDSSTGAPDTHAYGVRARLDWEDAVVAGGFALSPYADLTHSVLRIDAYTETGGGFSALFNARRETVTELRLGFHAARPMTGETRFLGLAEVAHRFQENSAATTGELTGMFAFNLPGQAIQKDWVRLGAGIESRLGDGTGALMLNLTTRGSAPSAWLALSYRIGF